MDKPRLYVPLWWRWARFLCRHFGHREMIYIGNEAVCNRCLEPWECLWTPDHD